MGTILLFFLLATTAAHAQTKPFKPEKNGVYYTSKDAEAVRKTAKNRLQQGAQDSTLSGIEASDSKNGFRRYVLGAPVKDYPNLTGVSHFVYVLRSVGGAVRPVVVATMAD